MRKVLIIRVEIEEADYEEARQFYSDEEIRDSIKEAGLSELSELVMTCVQRAQREDRRP